MLADFSIAGSQKRIVSNSKHNLRSCFSNNGLCSLTITTTAVPLLSATEVALLGTFRTKMIKTQPFTKFGRKHNEFLAVHHNQTFDGFCICSQSNKMRQKSWRQQLITCAPHIAGIPWHVPLQIRRVGFKLQRVLRQIDKSKKDISHPKCSCSLYCASLCSNDRIIWAWYSMMGVLSHVSSWQTYLQAHFHPSDCCSFQCFICFYARNS